MELGEHWKNTAFARRKIHPCSGVSWHPGGRGNRSLATSRDGGRFIRKQQASLPARGQTLQFSALEGWEERQKVRKLFVNYGESPSPEQSWKSFCVVSRE